MDEFKYLWDGSSPDWVLITTEGPDKEASSLETSFLAYNARTSMALIIEDDALARRVYERMLSAGVTVFTMEQMKESSSNKQE